MGSLFERIKQVIRKLLPAPEAPEPPPPVKPPAPEEVAVTPKQQLEEYADHASKVALIRTAAKRRTLVFVRYHNRWRHVEPYSLRPGKQADNLGKPGILFYGHDLTANNTHSYYIHKIEGLVITDIPYAPRWTIEL